VLLIVGIVFVVVGISDFAIAALLARSQAASTGGLGAEPPAVSRMLRRAGAVTVLVGAVLILVGLAS
jgi:uncharacterized membrane protein HdeD (DUF308 family)